MPSTTPDSSPRTPQRRGRPWRRSLPWLGAAALLALITAGLWPRPVPVETAKVTRGTLRITVNEEGKTRIKQRYVVSAPVAGQLRRLPLKAGAELVSTQTVVAIIDPLRPALLDSRTHELAQARRDNAQAQLERAQAARKFALLELRRHEILHAEKTVSTQELEKMQWNETAAARELAAAEAMLREAEAELIQFTNPIASGPPVEMRTPVCGRVLRVFEESSRPLPAGTPILEVGDPTDLEVVIEVLSRDGATIQAGAPVELEQWGGAQPLQAVVRYVEPAAFTKVSALGVEEQRVYVVADLITPPDQRGNLGDNFRVEARIITWQNDQILKAPSGALFRLNQRWHAYVLDQNRARLRPVQVGHTGDTEIEILDGLQENEEVILYPGDRITEAQRVKVVTF